MFHEYVGAIVLAWLFPVLFRKEVQCTSTGNSGGHGLVGTVPYLGSIEI